MRAGRRAPARCSRWRVSPSGSAWRVVSASPARCRSFAWEVLAVALDVPGAGAVAFGLGTALVLAGVAWWGSPPWGSRVLGREVPRRGRRGHRALLGAVALAALAVASVALLLRAADV